MTQKSQEERILNYTLRSLTINELCPNSVDGIVVSMDSKEGLRMDLPSSLSSDLFRKWFKGKGGIFSKDVKNFIKGKPSGKYILMEGEGERTILRLIEDEEYPEFEMKKLVDGKVKDKAYMTLRTLKKDESLTTSTRYIEEIEIPIEEIEPLDMPQDEDSVIQSLQLFADTD